MIHQLTGKKNKFILLIIIFIFLNTISLKEKNVIFGNVQDIKVIGLENHLNESIKDRLNYLKNNRLFSINKEILTKQITNYNYIESYKVFKLYPDNLILSLEQTKFLASTIRQNKKYLIGSNAKLIDYDLFSENKNLPMIYGNFQPEDFIILKKKK